MKISILTTFLILLPLLNAQIRSSGLAKLNFTNFEDLVKKMNEDFFNDISPFKAFPSPSNQNERQKFSYNHSNSFEERHHKNSDNLKNLRKGRDEHDRNRNDQHRHKNHKILIKVLLISSIILIIFIFMFIFIKLIRSCCLRLKERKARRLRRNIVANNVNPPNAFSYGVPIRMNNMQNPQNYWYGVPPQNMPYYGVPPNTNYSYEMIQPQGGFNYPSMGQPMGAPAPQVPQQNGGERRENPYPRI